MGFIKDPLSLSQVHTSVATRRVASPTRLLGPPWLLALRHALQFKPLWGRRADCRRRVVLRSPSFIPNQTRRYGHVSRLPPHHFPSNQPTNPGTHCHAILIGESLYSVDDCLGEPDGHGCAQAASRPPVRGAGGNLVRRVSIELVYLVLMHAATLSLLGIACQADLYMDRRLSAWLCSPSAQVLAGPAEYRPGLGRPSASLPTCPRGQDRKGGCPSRPRIRRIGPCPGACRGGRVDRLPRRGLSRPELRRRTENASPRYGIRRVIRCNTWS